MLYHVVVAAELGIDRSTVSKWCSKEKENIEKAYDANFPSGRKKLRKGKFEMIDESRLEWLPKSEQQTLIFQTMGLLFPLKHRI